MYTSITELPTQVTASLNDRDAGLWMKRYNEALGDSVMHDDVRKARRAAWEAVKNEPSSFSFCIKASVEAIDRDGEIIDVESIKKHLDSFIDYGGNVQNEHSNYNVATIWGWDPILDKGRQGVAVWGNIFGGDQVYDEARRNFVNGRNSLSVAGEATEGKYTCDDKGCYVRRNVKQLLEISLCDVPANKHATMLWYNKGAALTKSYGGPGIKLSVDEYNLHKDAQFCHIQAVKQQMYDMGFAKAHAREDGVMVDTEEYEGLRKSFEGTGLYTVRYDDGVLVNTFDKILEHDFKAGFAKGYVDEYGLLTDSVPEDVFRDLCRRNTIERCGGIYAMRLRHGARRRVD